MSSHKRYDIRCCEVADCDSLSLCYRFPDSTKKPTLHNAWRRFVRNYQRPEFIPDSKSTICFDHFDQESFKNFNQFNAGFAARLILKADAVPSGLTFNRCKKSTTSPGTPCPPTPPLPTHPPAAVLSSPSPGTSHPSTPHLPSHSPAAVLCSPSPGTSRPSIPHLSSPPPAAVLSSPSSATSFPLIPPSTPSVRLLPPVTPCGAPKALLRLTPSVPPSTPSSSAGTPLSPPSSLAFTSPSSSFSTPVGGDRQLRHLRRQATKISPVKRVRLIPATNLKSQPGHIHKASKPPTVRRTTTTTTTRGNQTRKSLLYGKRRSVGTQCGDGILEYSASETEADSESESDEDHDEDEVVHPDDHDEEYIPNEPELIEDHFITDECSRKQEISIYNSPKVIVEETALESLLSVCRKCTKTAVIDQKTVVGAYINYSIICLYCNTTSSFETTPKIGRFHTINVNLSASILFNGLLPTFSLRLLESLGVRTHTVNTYQQHQRNFLHGVIREKYLAEQDRLLEDLKGKCVEVSGDGRCDSPGHSALYGMYSLMCVFTRKILTCHILKSTQCSSSNAMELDGLNVCLDELEKRSVKVTSLTTDRHPQVEAAMKKREGLTHYADLWHIVKGLKKKLAEVSKLSKFRKLAKWIRAITSHMYWSVKQTQPHTQDRRELWLTLGNHLQNVHKHPKNKIHTKCSHPPLPAVFEKNGKLYKRDYFKKGGIVAQKVIPMLEDQKIIDSILRASPHHTGELESFHSAYNRNCPKNFSFSHDGMISRAMVTVLHHNSNVNRNVKKNKDGSDRMKKHRKKTNNQTPTAYWQKEDCDYGYQDDLFMLLESKLRTGKHCEYTKSNAPTLASKGEQLSREEIIKRHQSRGVDTGVKPHYVVPEDEEVEGSRRKRKTVSKVTVTKKTYKSKKTGKKNTAPTK